MLDTSNPRAFRPINRAYNSVFRPGRLSIGLVVPLEAYPHVPAPTMEQHSERAQLAERLGFSALWLRDVPFNVPSFGDAGQMFDPFVYLGYLGARTSRIALGAASIVLPLRHPAHVAKAAASADVLTGGRLLLGIASGDRPEEYPAMDKEFENRGERFRDSVTYIRRMAESYPAFESGHGSPYGMDMLPKPEGGRLPLLITGGSRQHPDWVAEHGDGWMTYPRNVTDQARVVSDYRSRLEDGGQPDKPVMQSLYIDLAEEPDTAPRPIHLGFRSGERPLLAYLKKLEEIGVNHVALNLRFNRAEIEPTLERLARVVMPAFADQGQ